MCSFVPRPIFTQIMEEPPSLLLYTDLLLISLCFFSKLQTDAQHPRVSADDRVFNFAGMLSAEVSLNASASV